MVHKYIKSVYSGNCRIFSYAILQVLLFILFNQLETSQAMVLYEPRDRFTVSNDSFVSNKSPEISLNSDNKSISEAGIVKNGIILEDTNDNLSKKSNTSSIDDDSSTIITDFIFRLKTNDSINKLLNVFNLARMDNSQNNIQLRNSQKMLFINEPQTLMLKQIKYASASKINSNITPNNQNSTNKDFPHRNDTTIKNETPKTTVIHNITTISMTTTTTSIKKTSTKPTVEKTSTKPTVEKTSNKPTVEKTSTKPTISSTSTTTSSLNTSSTTIVTKTTKPSFTTTVSIENPQFVACVNACGTDHDCVREKCLLDSTYFG